MRRLRAGGWASHSAASARDNAKLRGKAPLRSRSAILRAAAARARHDSHPIPCIEGKQDLEKQLLGTMKGWLVPDAAFVVLRDQDA